MARPQHFLDWSQAFSHRLQGLSRETSSLAGKKNALAARLAGELDKGLLPCLNMPFKKDLERDLPAFEQRVKPFKHMLVLGIGGSALGARALQKAFFPAQDRPGHNGPWLWIADNIDPDTLTAWMDTLPPRETVVVVISKSGGTIETMGQYFLLRSWLRQALGALWQQNVILITDEKSGDLRAEATALNLPSLPVPDFLGGRYSVLSAVGLVPAAFLGMNWRGLLQGAAEVNASLVKAGGRPESMADALGDHPAWGWAVWAAELLRYGYSELIFFSYIPLWNFFGAWFSQLWAESLGKEGKGSMPVPAVGVTDQHSLNQMFLDGPRNKGCLFLSCPRLYRGPSFGTEIPGKWSYLAGRQFGDLLLAEALGTRMALTRSQVPLLHICLDAADEAAAGRLMGLCMAATILTGWLLEINPLDQPAVELGKRLANARLGAPGYAREDEDLRAFLRGEENSEGRQAF
ncbi:MAG: glucose-6-phosphate isomerase [Desulfovibrio sp.]|jgi:glucose-6-phosphate isomerase|nr:glucose-6-phosphate isomerase [Desulfovibrio sp.]